MPKNTVSDPITDQEITFAHLIMAGTMNDRSAAEAAGLNPETAAYTKAKPRVRAYMHEHRAAVSEKLVDQEAEGLRQLNFGRDQILDRLWELATLSSEATRGSIAGQIKALAMIIAIEGLIPDRRLSPPAAQIPKPDPAPQAHPTPPPTTVNHTSSPNLDQLQPGLANPFINPEKENWVPDATGSALNIAPDGAGSHRQPFSRDNRFSGRRR
jgi:hypothetical protein